MSRNALAMISITALAASGASADVLLIPNTGTGFDNIWAFNTFDGSLVNNNIIPSDGNMAQVISAVDSGNNTILMSDESNDAILEYGYNGAFLGTVTNLAMSGLDDPHGMTVFNNQIYVTVRSGAFAGTVQRYNLDGTGQTTFASDALLGTPRDIHFRSNDALVSDSGNEDIHSFSLSGAINTPIWHDSDGVNGIDFPQQIAELPNGDVLVAGFSPPNGIYQYDANGNQVNFFTLNTSPRGVAVLGNGKVLWAGGTRVGVLDLTTGISVDVVNESGASFRFIEPSAIPSPASAALLTLGALTASRRRR
ncbi:MAG: hypothetical protein KDA30_05520 [Phycisphaerales bacterium]|nr:hypothetical protein [Phycisphaerales bacterium]